MDALIVREAGPDDAGSISALIVSLARYFLADPDDPRAAEDFFETVSPEQIAHYMQGGRFRYHVAEVNGVLAGAVGVRDTNHLYHLFVAEAYHGRGIGGRLWSVARSAAGNPGRWTVNSSRYAIPMYERLGFRPTDTMQVMHGIAFLPMRLDENPPAPA